MANSFFKISGGIALALTLTGVAGTASAEDKPPIVARAEQCLRQKVERVVSDEQDIAAAANFLVNFACAEETAGATRYLRNQAYVQLFSMIGKTAAMASSASKPPAGAAPGATTNATAAAATMSAVLGQLRVDPETGEIALPPGLGAPSQVNGMLTQLGTIMGQFAPETTPVPLRKLAGDLVLDARERRRGK